MPNLSPGDICCIKYDKKVGKADYRLCQVVKATKDEKGLVRTVTVQMRPRDSREKTLPYKSKDMVNMETDVNRLVLITPASELPVSS